MILGAVSNLRIFEIFVGPAIIAAIVSSLVAIFNSRRALQDSLDSKSGWRKEIFKVASKTFLCTDDIYLVLAAIRFIPYHDWNEYKDKVPQNFNEMTSYIYYKLHSILDNYNYIEPASRVCRNQEISIILTKEHANTVRLLTKYLLKHHWENLGNGYIGRLKFRVIKESNIIREVYDEIEYKKERE